MSKISMDEVDVIDLTMEDETVENVINLTMDRDNGTVIVVNKIEDISDDLFADTEDEEDTGNKVAIEKYYDRLRPVVNSPPTLVGW